MTTKDWAFSHTLWLFLYPSVQGLPLVMNCSKLQITGLDWLKTYTHPSFEKESSQIAHQGRKLSLQWKGSIDADELEGNVVY